MTELKYFCYPAPFIRHPDIGHFEMVEQVFPYCNLGRMSLNKYINYHQATYLVLASNFEDYLAYREEEFWKKFFKRSG